MFRDDLTRFVATVALALALSAAPALSFDEGGDDYGDTGGGTVASLADARADIGAKRWQDAIEKLSAFVQANPQSADGYNLLGYSLRNAGNTSRAMQAYDKALDLDPNHTGALEYQGVLFVMLGDLDKANANLARIEAICGPGCEEYEDLAEAIDG
jgi:cytochrome c-type biogenesis protein CcmH/NrfG